MDLPNRKHPRLKSYDYSLPGYYYVTIHAEKGAPSLSAIWQDVIIAREGQRMPGRPRIILTESGEIARQQLVALEKRFPMVSIDKYVIMPNHIHVILRILELSAGASPRPTLMDMIGTYKSLTTREINRRAGFSGRKVFQSSFYETVLRNEKAYQACWTYIDENPDKWLLNPEDI